VTLRRAATIACMFVCVSACGGRHDGAPRHRAHGAPVATLNGEAIGADEVLLVARRARVTPRVALDRIINDRLLAAEARRRRLVDDTFVSDAAWRARVQLLIEREVEARFSYENMPAGVFRSLYEIRRVALTHDGLVEVIHALAQVDGDAGVGARDEAHQLIGRFHARLTAEGPSLTRARFEAIAREFPSLRIEGIPGFDRTGQSADGTRFAEAFVRAAWSLSASAPLSAPVDTPFGVHVVLRVGEVPPLQRPADEVRTTIIREAVTAQRTRTLNTLVERLRARVDVRVSETALGATPRVEVTASLPVARP
jgi:hypothetical protein